MQFLMINFHNEKANCWTCLMLKHCYSHYIDTINIIIIIMMITIIVHYVLTHTHKHTHIYIYIQCTYYIYILYIYILNIYIYRRPIIVHCLTFRYHPCALFDPSCATSSSLMLKRSNPATLVTCHRGSHWCWMISLSYVYWLVVEPYPSEKWWTSSVGVMTFPIWWEKYKIHVSNHQPVYFRKPPYHAFIGLV